METISKIANGTFWHAHPDPYGCVRPPSDNGYCCPSTSKTRAEQMAALHPMGRPLPVPRCDGLTSMRERGASTWNNGVKVQSVHRILRGTEVVGTIYREDGKWHHNGLGVRPDFYGACTMGGHRTITAAVTHMVLGDF